MIKLIKLVVNKDYRLLGFMAEGTEKDFGGSSRHKVTDVISLNRMKAMGFKNKQIVIRNGVIVEQGDFRLNHLDMLMAVDEGGFIPVDNTIAITKVYMMNNERVGFELTFGDGSAHKISYNNTISLCDLFRPLNFVVRYKDNKRFIAGKANSSLSSIPVETLGVESKAKKPKPAAKAIEQVTGDFINEIDILDLYDFIREVNGFIVNLPGTAYKTTTESSAVGAGFIGFDIGEVGTPWLDFNETKLNVSCNFKKPGVLPLEISPGVNKNIVTFVYRRKNIFYNGQNHIGRLGVIIPEGEQDRVLAKFGKSMSFTPITNDKMIQTMYMLTGKRKIVLYEVDTSKVGLIARSKLDELIIPTQDVYKYQLDLTKSKLIIKYLNGLMKELDTSGEFNGSKKEIAPQFKSLTSNELEVLEANGIDIYSGAFTLRDEGHKSSGMGQDDLIEMEYGIDGLYASKFTYKQICECGEKIPKFLKDVVYEFGGISDINTKMERASSLLEEMNSRVNHSKRKLWLHKSAMYLKSNKSGVHSHDKKNWELDERKRTKSKAYNCRLQGCEKLKLSLKNIDIH